MSKADDHYEIVSFAKRMIASIERLEDKIVGRGRVSLLTINFSFSFLSLLLDNHFTIGNIVAFRVLCVPKGKNIIWAIKEATRAWTPRGYRRGKLVQTPHSHDGEVSQVEL